MLVGVGGDGGGLRYLIVIRNGLSISLSAGRNISQEGQLWLHILLLLLGIEWIPILSMREGPEYQLVSLGSTALTRFSPDKPLHGTNATLARLKPACLRNGVMVVTMDS